MFVSSLKTDVRDVICKLSINILLLNCALQSRKLTVVHELVKLECIVHSMGDCFGRLEDNHWSGVCESRINFD